MPNFKEHATTGVVVGAAANLVWQLGKLYVSTEPPNGFFETVSRIDFLELGLFALGGAAIASLPDILEPAINNPNHRAFFHSIVFGGVVVYGAFGKHTQEWRTENRMIAGMAALCYLSHLGLDSGTEKGLPVI